MNEHYYLVEVPGSKEHKAQVVKATSMYIVDGCLTFVQSDESSSLTVAAFAPGRWITCKLGVMKSPDAERPPEAAPDA